MRRLVVPSFAESAKLGHPEFVRATRRNANTGRSRHARCEAADFAGERARATRHQNKSPTLSSEAFESCVAGASAWNKEAALWRVTAPLRVARQSGRSDPSFAQKARSLRMTIH